MTDEAAIDVVIDSGFDLSQYIEFELRRGDEDSADAADLDFDV